MTPREVLDQLTDKGVTVSTDGVDITLTAHRLEESDVELVRSMKKELVEELVERDEELREIKKRYNRTLKRIGRFDSAIEDPYSYRNAFEMILDQISSLLQKIYDAGYAPLRQEILEGFVVEG